MTAHAFIAMPFGTKAGADGKEIDFNRIYCGLLKPAFEVSSFDCRGLMSTSIFISYRRSNAGGYAGRSDTAFARNKVAQKSALKFRLAFCFFLPPRRL